MDWVVRTKVSKVLTEQVDLFVRLELMKIEGLSGWERQLYMICIASRPDCISANSPSRLLMSERDEKAEPIDQESHALAALRTPVTLQRRGCKAKCLFFQLLHSMIGQNVAKVTAVKY